MSKNQRMIGTGKKKKFSSHEDEESSKCEQEPKDDWNVLTFNYFISSHENEESSKCEPASMIGISF